MKSLYIMLIAFAALILLAVWNSKTSEYICSNCNHQFSINTVRDLISPQGVTTKFVECPKCHKRNWAKIVKK